MSAAQSCHRPSVFLPRSRSVLPFPTVWPRVRSKLEAFWVDCTRPARLSSIYLFATPPPPPRTPLSNSFTRLFHQHPFSPLTRLHTLSLYWSPSVCLSVFFHSVSLSHVVLSLCLSHAHTHERRKYWLIFPMVSAIHSASLAAAMYWSKAPAVLSWYEEKRQIHSHTNADARTHTHTHTHHELSKIWIENVIVCKCRRRA